MNDPTIRDVEAALRAEDRPTKFSGTKDTFASGATRDAGAGRGRYDLISTHAIRRLAKVYERGAVNHGARNWEKGIPFSRLFSSAKRHLDQALEGDTSEDHLAQAAWNIFCLMHFEELHRDDLNDIEDES